MYYTVRLAFYTSHTARLRFLLCLHLYNLSSISFCKASADHGVSADSLFGLQNIFGNNGHDYFDVELCL